MLSVPTLLGLPQCHTARFPALDRIAARCTSALSFPVNTFAHTARSNSTESGTDHSIW
jgi:hypothetical protein